MTWDGLDELKKKLENLPADLTGEAAHIVEGVANAAALDIRSAYPHHTGNLRDRVYVTHFTHGRYSAGATVASAAPHAWLYENGSAARHYFTEATGARHETGAMPAHHTFVRIVMRFRRERFYPQLAALLERHDIAARIDDALAA